MSFDFSKLLSVAWGGWTTTWPTQLLALIWLAWLASWVGASFW
ncbi:MAG: isoprenylcysteine carboxylmethyltransferase family protein, partial [Bradyrhizobium sp.]